jgi:hypothetical protein
MFELAYGVCFVVMPLVEPAGANVALDFYNGAKFVGITENTAKPDQCIIHMTGGSFTVAWTCERASDRVSAQCG